VSSLLLIDLSAIFWAAHHASANEELSAAFEKTLGAVSRLISEEKCDHVAIACDYPPYKRKALLPSYKANREAAPPLATEQLRKVEQRLRDDGLTVWSVAGHEADDVIATACLAAGDMRVVVASGDKDLLQLVSERVSVRAPTQRYDTEQAVEERWGIGPAFIGDMLALAGDKSDNIPGIEKCGPVTAAKWLKQYGSLEGVIAHAAELGRFADAVSQRAEDIRLWRKVVELDAQVPIDFGELFQEKVVKPLTKQDEPEDEPDDADVVSPPQAAGSGAESGTSPATVTELTLDMPKPTQIVRHQPQEGGGIVLLQPRTAKQAWWLSGVLLNSRLYTKFKSQDAVYAVIVRGAELGLGAMTALDVIHIVEGKPTMHAHLITARAMAHPKCKWFRMISSSSEEATYETQHVDYPDPTRLTYKIADAKAAGVCPMQPRTAPVLEKNDYGKLKDVRGQWEKRPAEMLRKTCAVQLVRVVYPDAALGIYATEELSDDE
jgi:5'-3' exonuclease